MISRFQPGWIVGELKSYPPTASPIVLGEMDVTGDQIIYHNTSVVSLLSPQNNIQLFFDLKQHVFSEESKLVTKVLRYS